MRLRLHVGSHLAQYLRSQLENEKGFTSTVGISTSKLLSKLVGNRHKPRAQTTLMPPYASSDDELDNVTAFVGSHEIGKIPGVGFKLSQKIKDYFLHGTADATGKPESGSSKEAVTVKEVRTHPSMNPELLDKILAGPGAPHGIGFKVWSLFHGIDDSAVAQASGIPKQISIEDSYVRLDSFDDALTELKSLSKSLIERIRIDLLEIDESKAQGSRRWLALPKTIRLSTRPRVAQNHGGSRSRVLSRISRSGALPNFVFDLSESCEALAERLVGEAVLPLFRRLHPEKSGWDLSLINIAVANMIDTASNSKSGTGRDISKMFREQPELLNPWKHTEHLKHLSSRSSPDSPCDRATAVGSSNKSNESFPHESAEGIAFVQMHQVEASDDDEWEAEDTDSEGKDWTDLIDCEICGARVPAFVSTAHQRFHHVEDG